MTDDQPSTPDTFLVPAYMPCILLEANEYLETVFYEGFREHILYATGNTSIQERIIESEHFIQHAPPLRPPLCQQATLRNATTRTCCKYEPELFPGLKESFTMRHIPLQVSREKAYQQLWKMQHKQHNTAKFH
jgi:hypothetical protein